MTDERGDQVATSGVNDGVAVSPALPHRKSPARQMLRFELLVLTTIAAVLGDMIGPPVLGLLLGLSGTATLGFVLSLWIDDKLTELAAWIVSRKIIKADLLTSIVARSNTEGTSAEMHDALITAVHARNLAGDLADIRDQLQLLTGRAIGILEDFERLGREAEGIERRVGQLQTTAAVFAPRAKELISLIGTATAASQRRYFWLGILLSFVVGLITAWIAFRLGWS